VASGLDSAGAASALLKGLVDGPVGPDGGHDVLLEKGVEEGPLTPVRLLRDLDPRRWRSIHGGTPSATTPEPTRTRMVVSSPSTTNTATTRRSPVWSTSFQPRS